MDVTLMLFVRQLKAHISARVKLALKEMENAVKILMNVIWSTMVVVCMSATIYQAIIAALVMMDLIWRTTGITVWTWMNASSTMVGASTHVSTPWAAMNAAAKRASSSATTSTHVSTALWRASTV